MAAQPWPVSLQDKVNQENFGLSIGETVVRSPTDVGPGKTRRRSTRPRDNYTVSINVTAAEYSTFRTFYDTTINGGAGTFTFNNPITGVLEEYRMTNTPSLRNLGYGTFVVNMVWESLGAYV